MSEDSLPPPSNIDDTAFVVTYNPDLVTEQFMAEKLLELEGVLGVSVEFVNR